MSWGLRGGKKMSKAKNHDQHPRTTNFTNDNIWVIFTYLRAKFGDTTMSPGVECISGPDNLRVGKKKSKAKIMTNTQGQQILQMTTFG